MHYFRILPEYWEDVLTKIKAAGLNTVETYTCWNLHEPHKGQFDTSVDKKYPAFFKGTFKAGSSYNALVNHKTLLKKQGFS